MLELKVKLLHPDAKLPVCANPRSDLGYDIFALEDVDLIYTWGASKIRTGITVELAGYGFLIRDRSSMAAKSVIVTGGVVDAGYRGEIMVLLTNNSYTTYHVKKGDKIAQLVPIVPNTHFDVIEVGTLSESKRGESGFGSTGK